MGVEWQALVKFFICVLTFHPHNGPVRPIESWFSFSVEGTGAGQLSDLPKVNKLVRCEIRQLAITSS